MNLALSCQVHCSPRVGLLHHSDRGSMYTAETYLALLRGNGMTASMSRTANCYDNVITESLFLSFNGHASMRHTFRRGAQARQRPFEHIETFYHRTRRHSSLGYMSPVVYEQLMS
jgi:putative transposase